MNISRRAMFLGAVAAAIAPAMPVVTLPAVAETPFEKLARFIVEYERKNGSLYASDKPA